MNNFQIKFYFQQIPKYVWIKYLHRWTAKCMYTNDDKMSNFHHFLQKVKRSFGDFRSKSKKFMKHQGFLHKISFH